MIRPKELVQHHVKEEESTIFQEARDKIGKDRLERLGAEMQRFKERALKAGAGGSGTSAARKAARGTPTAAPAHKTAGTGSTARRPTPKRSTAKKTARKAKRR